MRILNMQIGKKVVPTTPSVHEQSAQFLQQFQNAVTGLMTVNEQIVAERASKTRLIDSLQAEVRELDVTAERNLRVATRIKDLLA